jgi:predicted nuclease with TOPRIM domain
MRLHRFIVLSLAAAAAALPASAARAADEQKAVKGPIQEVRAAAHQLVVKGADGKEWVFRVNDRSKLERRGRPVGLDQLAPGMHVQVTFAAQDGENQVVSMTSAPVSGAELRKDVQDTLRAAKSYSFEQKDRYSQRLPGVLKRVDDRLHYLQREAAREGEEAMQKLEPQIEKLRGVRDKLQSQAERVKSATPQAWDELKAGVHSALEDLHNAFEKVGQTFK